MSLFAYYRCRFLQLLLIEKISASRIFPLSLQSGLHFLAAYLAASLAYLLRFSLFFSEISFSFPPFIFLQRSWPSLLSFQRAGTARLQFHFWSVYLTHPAVDTLDRFIDFRSSSTLFQLYYRNHATFLPPLPRVPQRCHSHHHWHYPIPHVHKRILLQRNSHGNFNHRIRDTDIHRL